MGIREKKLAIIQDSIGNEKLETNSNESIPYTNKDIYVSLQANERLYELAFKYYGDSTLWWFIAKANDLLLPYNISSDIILRIPPKSLIN